MLTLLARLWWAFSCEACTSLACACLHCNWNCSLVSVSSRWLLRIYFTMSLNMSPTGKLLTECWQWQLGGICTLNQKQISLITLNKHETIYPAILCNSTTFNSWAIYIDAEVSLKGCIGSGFVVIFNQQKPSTSTTRLSHYPHKALATELSHSPIRL